LSEIAEAASETHELSENDATAPQLVIWGTDVVVHRCKEKFKRFIKTFVDPNAEEDERTNNMDPTKPLYIQKLEEVNPCVHLRSPLRLLTSEGNQGQDEDIESSARVTSANAIMASRCSGACFE